MTSELIQGTCSDVCVEIGLPVKISHAVLQVTVNFIVIIVTYSPTCLKQAANGNTKIACLIEVMF